MDPISGIISIGGGLLNNYFAGERQEQQQQFAAQQAQNQMNFQERMRATAYQTATADMKAAGLNPMMAAGVNTSVPSGAAGSASQAPVHDVVGPALASAMQSAKLQQELALGKEQIKNVMADTDKKDSEKWNVQAQTADTMGKIEGTVSQSKILKQMVEKAINEGLQAKNERKYIDSALAGVVQPTGKAMQDIYKMIPPIKFDINRNSARQQGWVGGNEVDTTSFNSRFGASYGR